MLLFSILLFFNSLLHVILVSRFGVKENKPPLLFAVIYAVLGISVYLNFANVLWAVLLLSILGFTGLTVTFNKSARDKTIDKIIWITDVVTILYAIYLLFLL